MSHKRSHSRSRSHFGELTSTGDLLKIYGTIQQSNEQEYSQLLKQYREYPNKDILDKLKQKRSDMKKMLRDTSAICQMSVKKLYTPPLETISEASSEDLSEASSEDLSEALSEDLSEASSEASSKAPSEKSSSSRRQHKYKPTLPSVRE